MPRTIAIVGSIAAGALLTAAPAALAVRAPKPAESRQIRAALTSEVAQAFCSAALVSAEKCAASTLGVQKIRIASANPKYAWVTLAVTSGPAAEDWFAQDGNIWKKTGSKWKAIKGSGCSFPVMRRLPKPVYDDFGAEYCGIRPSSAGGE